MTTHTVNTSYSGVTKYPEALALNDTLHFNPTSTGRSGTIMKWIVPMNGKYKITAAGAQGGGEQAIQPHQVAEQLCMVL